MSSDDHEVNGWSTWSKHVLRELERQSEVDEEVRRELRAFKEQVIADLAVLKVKAGLWGLIGGMLPAIATLIIIILEFFIKKGV